MVDSGLVQRVWSGRQKPLMILEIGRNFISKSGTYTIFVRTESKCQGDHCYIFENSEVHESQGICDHSCLQHNLGNSQGLPRALPMPSVCNCCVYAPAYSCSRRIIAFPSLPPLNSTGFLLIGRTEPAIC